ncbi:MAG TPA: M14 family metallocarboxypeptidase [Candidatus Methylacidiphilales bacterium]|nr:M14 family metallocarboxypeptidase [Candidatus Methylacidiphilales bacterium]
MDILDPATFARDIETIARAGGWDIRYLSPCASGTRPWFQRAAGTGGESPAFYLSTGIHGDEISGLFAVMEMLRRPDFFRGFHTVIFPILNPDGIVRGIRENAAGIDLNRDYREPKSAEITSHIEALKTLGHFDAAMLLHEDFEGAGAYLYELNDTRPTTGRKIIAAMGRHVPIDLRHEIEGVPAEGGIILRRNIVLKHGPIAERKEWPEAIYLSLNHTEICYTTETPKPFPLSRRVQAQIAAVEILLETLNTDTGPE